MAGSGLTKLCAFSQPGCRRGSRCPAVLHANPNIDTDMYGLIFSLRSVQELPVSYSTFLHRHWCWKLFPSTGVLRVKRTEKNEQWWGWKKKYFLPLWPPLAHLTAQPWGLKLRISSPLLPWEPDCWSGGLTHGGLKHIGLCLLFPFLLQVPPRFTESWGKFVGLGAKTQHHSTDLAPSLWTYFGANSLSWLRRIMPSLSQVPSFRFLSRAALPTPSGWTMWSDGQSLYFPSSTVTYIL